MSYKQLAKLSITYNGEFGKAISYCVQDCQVVRDIDEMLCLSDTKISYVDKCKIPINLAFTMTPA